jgi:pimeloyl-ACP methyl ester carboxylesterase
MSDFACAGFRRPALRRPALHHGIIWPSYGAPCRGSTPRRDRAGATSSQGIIWNGWRQGMMGNANAHHDGIVAFSQTDFTDDLKSTTIPVLVMHGDDDLIVPYADSGLLSA